MEGIIYKYINKINKKVYIGQTRYEKSRICNHKNPKVSDNTLFHNAIRKYGWENFEYKVLFRINCNNIQDLNITLNSKEKVAIKYFNSCNRDYGYNMTLGGDSFIEGKHITQELRDKRSIITKTRFSIEENKNYLYKPVVQLDLNGNLIKEWKGSKFITEELGISKDSIKNCCKGKYSSVYGYIFLWKNDYDKFIIENNLIIEISERLKKIEKFHVLQLSIDGNTIREWDSISQASSELNIKKKLIKNACEGIINEAGGYYWKWKHGEISYSSKKIIQLDLNGNFIREWDSIKSIQKYFKSNTTVLEVCRNQKHYNTSMGYRWMYKEDYDKILDKSIIDKEIKTKIIKVVQLDLNGNFIKEWNSIKEASRETDICDTDISRNCKKYTKRAGTYVWIYAKEYYKISPNKEKLNINIKDNRLFKNKKVVQLDLDGNFIKEWDNCSIAEKTLLNIKHSKGGVSSCCTRKIKSFHGYKWMYKEDWENGKKD